MLFVPQLLCYSLHIHSYTIQQRKFESAAEIEVESCEVVELSCTSLPDLFSFFCRLL